MSIGPLGTNFSEIWREIHFFIKKDAFDFIFYNLFTTGISFFFSGLLQATNIVPRSTLNLFTSLKWSYLTHLALFTIIRLWCVWVDASSDIDSMGQYTGTYWPGILSILVSKCHRESRRIKVLCCRLWRCSVKDSVIICSFHKLKMAKPIQLSHTSLHTHVTLITNLHITHFCILVN